jgi:hypothetical protein
MTRARRILLGVVGVSSLACLSIVASTGCGGDDSSGIEPSGDAGGDVTVESDASKDGSTAADGGATHDATTPVDGSALGDGASGDGGSTVDSGSAADGGTTEGGHPGDGGGGNGDASDAATHPDADAQVTDAQVTDAQVDAAAPKDAGADAAETADAADAAIVFFDAGEAGLSVATFTTEIAQALCQGLARCCTVPNGSSFDMAGCINTQMTTNFNTGANVADSGDLTLDPVKAQACLNDLASVNCAATTGTDTVKEFDDCYTALSGTLTTGAPCVKSVECVQSDFCDLPTDGGATGTCQPMRTSGEPCGDFGSRSLVQSEEACSYRGSGNTGLRCANVDLATLTVLDAGTWVCSPEVAPDSGCGFAVDCTTRLCDPGPGFSLYQCVDTKPYVYPAVCASYIVDGG